MTALVNFPNKARVQIPSYFFFFPETKPARSDSGLEMTKSKMQAAARHLASFSQWPLASEPILVIT